MIASAIPAPSIDALHTAFLGIVPRIERRKASTPALDLGMVRVSALSLRQDRPGRMKLAMLAQQVPVAELARIEIPDAHAIEASGEVWLGSAARVG